MMAEIDGKKPHSASQLFISAGALIGAVAVVMLAWFNVEGLVERRIKVHSRPIEQRLNRHEEKRFHDGMPPYVDGRLSDTSAQLRQTMIELKALIQKMTDELQQVRESVARLEVRQ